MRNEAERIAYLARLIELARNHTANIHKQIDRYKRKRNGHDKICRK